MSLWFSLAALGVIIVGFVGWEIRHAPVLAESDGHGLLSAELETLSDANAVVAEHFASVATDTARSVDDRVTASLISLWRQARSRRFAEQAAEAYAREVEIGEPSMIHPGALFDHDRA